MGNLKWAARRASARRDGCIPKRYRVRCTYQPLRSKDMNSPLAPGDYTSSASSLTLPHHLHTCVKSKVAMPCRAVIQRPGILATAHRQSPLDPELARKL